MAEQFMRIGGTDGKNARPLRTDRHGNVGVQLTEDDPLNFQVSDLAWTAWGGSPLHFRGNTYIAGVSRAGDIKVYQYNHENKVTNSFVLDEQLNMDDHCVTQILIMPSTREVAVFWTSHNSANTGVRYRISKAGEDISDFEEVQNLPTTGPVTYIQAYYYGGNYFAFTREQGKSWAYCYSNDNMVSWTESAPAFQSQYFQSKKVGASKYALAATSPHGNTYNSHDIAAFHINLETGDIEKLDGTILANLITGENLPLQGSQGDFIYGNDVTDDKSVLMDVYEHAPYYVAYAKFPTEGTYEYYVASYEDGEYVSRKVAEGEGSLSLATNPHYVGYASLGHPKGTLYTSEMVNGVWEIFQYNSNDNFETFNKTQITRDSKVDNFRPKYVIQSREGKSLLPFVWMKGYYPYYTDYYTDIEHPFKMNRN